MIRLKTTSSIWEAALGDIQLQINKTNFQTWLKNTSGLGYDDHRFKVGVPSVFASAWLEKRLYSLIKRTLVKITGDPDIEITFVVSSENNKISGTDTGASSLESPESPQNNLARNLLPPSTLDTGHKRLNPNYTFNKFIVCDYNRLAYHAALSASEKPGDTYNPVFIYAESGLGKTHLLQSIAHKARENEKSFVLVTAEKFTNEFIESLREKRMSEFRHKYRCADILLMDDIDFISGKDHTQEGFYHTIKDLQSENRQIVLTGSNSPNSIPGLNSKLRSCLEGGLTVDIKKPDLNARILIVKLKTGQRGINLLPDVIEYIASFESENVKRLEGNVNKIIEVQRLKGTIDLALAKETLEDTPEETSKKKRNPEEIIAVVSERLHLSLEAVTNTKKRSIELNRARQIIIYLLREKYNCTYNEIGSFLGGKDHSTVLYGFEKASNLLEKEPQFRTDVEEMTKVLT